MEYPEIDTTTVLALPSVLQNVRVSPEYLDNSPWNPVLRNTLRILAQGAGAGSTSEGAKSNLSIDSIDYEKESIALYESINAINNFEDIDVKERISVIKLKTGILQQLLDMMKDSRRIKQINRFEEVVYSLLTEEQKDKLLEL